MNRCFRTTVIAFMWILFAGLFAVVECCRHDAVNSTSAGKIPLYIGGMFSVDGESWDGSGCLVAAELALEQINNRSDILQDYELRMLWHDTQCEASKASRALFDFLVNEPEKIILLGPGCSVGAAITSKVSSHWNLVTVLNSATAELLANREEYPNVYRTTPRNADIIESPFLWMMKEYGWRKVGHLTEQEDTFSRDHVRLIEEAAKLNAEVVSEVITKDVGNQVDRFKKENIKIMYLTTLEKATLRFFCEAQRKGLTGEDVFWIVPDWYGERWWLVEDGEYDCSPEEMAEIVGTSLLLSLGASAVSLLNETTVSGLVPAEVLGVIEDRLTWPQYDGFTTNNYLGYTVDAVWTIGLMLNRTARNLRGMGAECLEDFTNVGDKFYNMFLNELANTNFFGASGDVTFSNGERLGSAQVSQLRVVPSTGVDVSTTKLKPPDGTEKFWIMVPSCNLLTGSNRPG